MDVEVKIYDKTSSLHADMAQDVPSIILMNSYGYVYGHAKYPNYTAFGVLGKNNRLDSYKSCIIVAAESKYQTLDELIADATNVDLRFVYATSTSGHIVPRYELRKHGVQQAEVSFKNIDFSGDHEVGIMQVVNGEATALACGEPSLEYCVSKGSVTRDQYRVIWKSHDIQGAPFVYNELLDADVKKNIEDAIFSMSEKSPETYTYIQQVFHADKDNGFIEVEDNQYDAIRNMASSMDDLILFLNFYMQ